MGNAFQAGRIRLFAVLLALLLSVPEALAQIPYYAPTVGDGHLYGYTSLKIHPGLNRQVTYSNLQYGLSDAFAVGTDLYTCTDDSSFIGACVRYGKMMSPWFSVGGQFSSSFDLDNRMRYSYSQLGIFMNGQITRNGRLFWAGNTFWSINRDDADYLEQYAYLGYSIPFNNGTRLTPMAGIIFPWTFDYSAEAALGAYFTVKHCSFYLWASQLNLDNPRLVFGFEFVI